jgi:hypothetical protein
LGETQSEREHDLTSARSYTVTYRGRNGRDARSGGFFEFEMGARPGPLILRATYCGDERARDFDILVDNALLATQHLEADRPGGFFDVDYDLPQELTQSKRHVRLRFVAHAGSTAGPVFGARLLAGSSGGVSKLVEREGPVSLVSPVPSP